MSLNSFGSHFLAYPPLDVPISQPAFGDNLAWTGSENGGQENWATFESTFDDSWTWERRKEELWQDRTTQESFLISVKPSGAADKDAATSDRERSKRRGQATSDQNHVQAGQSMESFWNDLMTQEGMDSIDWTSMDTAEDPAHALHHQQHKQVASQAQSQAQPPLQDHSMTLANEITLPSTANFAGYVGTHEDLTINGISSRMAVDDSNLGDVCGFTWPDVQTTSYGSNDMNAGLNALLEVPMPAISQPRADMLQGSFDNSLPEWLSAAEVDVMMPSVALQQSIHDEHNTASPSNFPSPLDTSEESVASPTTNEVRGRLVACTTCGKLVKSRKFKDHIRWHVKSQSCDVCEKSFATERDLKRHQKQHTGEKPFKCEVQGCKYAEIGFARRDNLQRHAKKMHESTAS